jgi:hypothetical protein
MAIQGTIGNDNVSGNQHNDKFNLTQGGDDTATGLAGDDLFIMKGALSAGDAIDGGDDIDKMTLNGDYSAGFVFGASTITNIEILRLGGDFDYDLTMDDGNVGANQKLSVNAASLGAGNSLTFDGSAETDGRFVIYGSAGDDVLTGGARGDRFSLKAGGNETILGGGGADRFFAGNAFDTNDDLNGGAGYDILELNGNAYYDVTFNGTDLADIEEIDMVGANAYFLKFDDDVLQSGEHMTLDGSTSGSLSFWGGSESDGGSFTVICGTGFQNVLYGGSANDVLDVRHGQDDGLLFMGGNGGDDILIFGSNYNNGDGSAYGGTGNDTVVFDGDYPTLAIEGGVADLWQVETVKFAAGHDYGQFFTPFTVTGDVSSTAPAGTTSGLTVTWDASELGVGDLFNLNLSGSTAAAHIIMGGDGSDQITGNANNDTFIGGLGRDSMYGGSGNDVFVVNDVSESTSLVYDAPVGINWDTDKIDLDGAAPTAINAAVNGGTLNQDGSFDSTLETLVGAGQLAAGHAVIFTADSGAYNGLPLLIVDANGTAGYQGGQDYIFYISGHTGTLDTSDFI